MFKNVKNAVTGHMLLVILTVKKSLKRLIEKSYEKQIKKSLEFRVIKRKGNKLYVKWKGYNNFFNKWIENEYVSVTEI